MADHAKEYRAALRAGDLQKAKELIGQGVDKKQFLDEPQSTKPYVYSFFLFLCICNLILKFQDLSLYKFPL